MWLDLRSLWEASGTSVSLSIDTPGAITLAGQSISANAGVDLSTQGAIAYAGQATTFGIGVAPTNGAITYAGQSVTFNDGVALSTQGAITLAGQSLALGAGLSVDAAGAITFAGQSLTAGIGIDLGTQGAITYAGQTVALDLSGAVALSIDAAGQIAYAGQDLVLVAPAAAPSVDQPSGGWPTFNAHYERELARRRKQREALAELEDETERIEQALDRDIARLLREQEAKDLKRAELERLRALTADLDAAEALKAHGERVAKALERAIAQGNYSALEALDREIARAREEEEVALLASLMVLDED